MKEEVDCSNYTINEPCHSSTPADRLENLNDTIVAGHFEYSGGKEADKHDGMNDVQKKEEGKENLDAVQHAAATKKKGKNTAQACVNMAAPSERIKVDKLIRCISGRNKIEVLGHTDDNCLEPNKKVHNTTYCKAWLQKECASNDNEKGIGYETLLTSNSATAQDDFETNVCPNDTSKSSDFLDISSALKLQQVQTTKCRKQTKKASVLGTLSSNVTKPSEIEPATSTMYVFYSVCK